MLALPGHPLKPALRVAAWIGMLLTTSFPAYGTVTIGEQRQVDTIGPGSTDTTGGGKFIGSDGSQYFYVCWTEHPNSGGPRIFCRTYDSTGGELVGPQRIDRSPMASAANVYGCNDNHGNIYVTWFRDSISHGEDITGNYYFNHSADHGASWSSTDCALNTRVQEAFYSKLPILTCDGSGHVYFFESYKDAGAQHLYVRVSADHGASWGSEIRLDSQSIDNNFAFFAFPQADREGVVYVSWLSGGTATNHMFINRSLDNGASWLDHEVAVDHSPHGIGAMINGYSPLATGAPGHLYAVWSDARVPGVISVFLNRSTDYGTSFQPADTPISVSTEGTCCGNVAAAADGHVFVTYLSQTDVYDLMRVRLAISPDDGATWPVRNKVIGMTGITALYFSTPNIAVDDYGRAYVMWVQYHRPEREADERVNVSADYGATWEGGEEGFSVITSAPSNSTEQNYKIGADQQGNAVAVWSEIQRPATNFHEQLNVISVATAVCDAGTPDAGSDAGTPDGGGLDGGIPDGGSDAGLPDAGRHDAGSDAGTTDGGGQDAGSDAGAPDAGGLDGGSSDPLVPERVSTGCHCGAYGDPVGTIALLGLLFFLSKRARRRAAPSLTATPRLRRQETSRK